MNRLTPILRTLIVALFLGSALALTTAVRAESASVPTEPTLEQRIADLEAYINNTGVGSSDDATWESKVAVAGPGHNAWLMTSSALVLFMTLPGLALFYGGLVRSKNVLSVMAQCMGIAGLVTILWWAVGFSLSFAEGNAFIGGTAHFFFKGVDSNPGALGWVSQNVFAIFQLTFAIITPALIVGAVAERMKFSAVLLFVTLWMFAVYFPMAHMVWGGGYMAGSAGAIKAIDFAGGTVVHMSSGFSALVLCIMLGKRRGHGKEPMAPHSMVLCMVGTGMLWVGWYGFNAGSAGAADGVAANAFTTTTLCAAVGGFVWAACEWLTKRKPSVLGFCSGIVGGLVVITPAAGFVSANSAVIMGVLGGIVPFIAVTYIKKRFGYDDALDTFGIHGVGGTLGAVLTGIFADAAINPMVADVQDGLVLEQIKAIVLTVVWSGVATVIITLIVKALVGLRPSEEVEVTGLDLSEHGEQGYSFETSTH